MHKTTTRDGGLQRTAGRPVRVLLIDDSPTMRRLIALSLARDPRVEVVGQAGDAAEARAQIKALNPDVLTLDVEMPGLSGLDFLERLMRMRPTPVVMVSTETHRGSAAAVAALALGAVDCFGKPRSYTGAADFAGLADMLVTAARANIAGAARRPTGPRAPGAPPGTMRGAAGEGPFHWNGRLLLIGASTGGVEAIERVLAGFPADCPPTAIVQHMPEGFLASFAQRLDSIVAPRVTLARDGLALARGQIVIAPGGDHHLVFDGLRTPVCRLLAAERRNGHRPSVDMAFESAAPFAQSVVAVLLTGMGRDGVAGMHGLRAAGARTLAQDADSSVVWGMPGAAWDCGAAEELVGLDAMGERLLALTGRARRTAVAS